MKLDEIELLLSSVASNFRTRDTKALRQDLAQHKKDFVLGDDQAGAKFVWCLESVLQIQGKYLEAFEDLHQGRFYAAWQAFERVEVEYGFLRRHLPPPHAVFYLDFMLSKTDQWQSLYPYRIFSSLEFIKKSRKCMICDQTVSLRRSCGHLMGEIYDGEMCCHEITEIDFTSISLVTHPHHKYTVMFPAGERADCNDSGKYDPLIRVMERLESPFDQWIIYEGKRAVGRGEFGEQDNESLCPCGSMESFGDCCSGKSEILVPWIHVEVGEVENPRLPDFLICDSS